MIDLGYEEESLKAPAPGVRTVRALSVPRFAVIEEEFEDDDNQVQISQDFVSTPTTDEPNQEITVSVFREDGLCVLEEQYIEDRLTHRDRFSYTDTSKLWKRVSEDLINENIEKEERQYHGDKLTQRTITYADGSQQRTLLKWSIDGSEAEVSVEGSDEIEGMERWKYNAEGRLSDRSLYDLDGKLIGSIRITYDSEGRITRRTAIIGEKPRDIEGNFYNKDGTMYAALGIDSETLKKYKRVYSYENGDCIRIEFNNGKEVTINEYDDQHRVIASRHQVPASNAETEILKCYNSKGLLQIEAERGMMGGTAVAQTTWWEYEYFGT